MAINSDRFPLSNNTKFPGHNMVVGLGVTGLSVVDYLSRQGAIITVIDSRHVPPKLSDCRAKFPKVRVMTGELEPDSFRRVDRVILSPGVPVNHPAIQAAIKAGTEVIGDVELFAREAKKPIIAITGSNGKSTVSALVADMLKAAGHKVGLGGNYGTPALSLLDEDVDFYVIECSSFQLETTESLRASVATILNLTPDHMDRYTNTAQYLQAKMRIFNHCETAVINRSQPFIPTIKGGAGVPQISFGLDVPPNNDYGLINLKDGPWLAKGLETFLPVKDVPLLGQHNIANVLAAMALCDAVGVNLEVMVEAIKNFKGLPHRCELVEEFNQVAWINDSKGTNVGATISALEGLDNRVKGKWVVILGGQSKETDFSPLYEPVCQKCKGVILIGETASNLHELFSSSGLQLYGATSMSQAVAHAYNCAAPGDGVLLSPACSSFDMFRNFEARGQAFKREVQRLAFAHETQQRIENV